MAYTAILENTATRRDERREERRAAAEQEHRQRIAENYRRLLFENAEEWSASDVQPARRASTETAAFAAPAAAPAATATLERAPVMPAHESITPEAQPEESDYSANTAQRLADYVAYAPARGKKMLFENIAYKDGELIDTRAAAAPAAAPAPVAVPAAPEVMPAAPAAPAEDDALPTRRTMETLRRGTEMTAPEARTSVLEALSLKTKLVLCAIAAAIVLIIALICVNTGILSAANAEIVIKEAQLQEIQSRYAQVQEDIDGVTSDEFIDAWAQQNGMTMGE